MKAILGLLVLISTLAFAEPTLINGRPVGNLFQGVGTFNGSCTITKIGKKQFITAAHCVDGNERSISLKFKTLRKSVKVVSLHVHPTWIIDCRSTQCSGREVGGLRMTPGRADVALFNVAEETPKIPMIEANFFPLVIGTEVTMVGAGCTRNIEPEGRSEMRYAITATISHEALNHQHSLYRNIAVITGQSDWITPGYGVSNANASLCPGDSGGPLLSKGISGQWEISGIAADYTFNGPYRDGNVTVTNLHTRLDDESLHNVGAWIRENTVE